MQENKFEKYKSLILLTLILLSLFIVKTITAKLPEIDYLLLLIFTIQAICIELYLLYRRWKAMKCKLSEFENKKSLNLIFRNKIINMTEGYLLGFVIIIILTN